MKSVLSLPQIADSNKFQYCHKVKTQQTSLNKRKKRKKKPRLKVLVGGKKDKLRTDISNICIFSFTYKTANSDEGKSLTLTRSTSLARHRSVTLGSNNWYRH